MAYLSIENVRKSFGKVDVLEGVKRLSNGTKRRQSGSIRGSRRGKAHLDAVQQPRHQEVHVLFRKARFH